MGKADTCYAGNYHTAVGLIPYLYGNGWVLGLNSGQLSVRGINYIFYQVTIYLLCESTKKQTFTKPKL